jgi:hypothetical protein
MLDMALNLDMGSLVGHVIYGLVLGIAFAGLAR